MIHEGGKIVFEPTPPELLAFCLTLDKVPTRITFEGCKVDKATFKHDGTSTLKLNIFHKSPDAKE